jgi:hypothetical protein
VQVLGNLAGKALEHGAQDAPGDSAFHETGLMAGP